LSDFQNFFGTQPNQQQQQAPQSPSKLPHLPDALSKFNIPGISANPLAPVVPTSPENLFDALNPAKMLDQATTAYCATQKPELYYYAAGAGAVAGVVGTMILVLVLKFVGSFFRRGRNAA
jgi:hypothetical protein